MQAVYTLLDGYPNRVVGLAVPLHCSPCLMGVVLARLSRGPDTNTTMPIWNGMCVRNRACNSIDVQTFIHWSV